MSLGLTRDEGLDTRRFSSEVGWHLPGIGQLRRCLVAAPRDPPTSTTRRRPADRLGRWRRQPRPGWCRPPISTGRLLIGTTGGWSHLIEPRVSFNYTPGNLNDSDIPNEDSQVFEFDETNLFKPSRFTGIDRVDSGARVSYGLGFNSLGPEAWRVSGVVGQSLRSGPTMASTRMARGSRTRSPDFVGRIDVRPSELLDLGYRFRADKSTLALRRSDLSLAFGPPRLRFDIQYLRLTEEVEEIASEDLNSREEIVAGLRLQVLWTASPSACARGATSRRIAR
ncbi:MAG: LPS assembly protein LptD [Geminicoccaceae bacterium]